MKRDIITISDSGAVAVPSEVRMIIYEIANLFDIFHQTAKRHIRSIEKSGIADGDYSMTCTVEGLTVYPEYYGLDMVMAFAFLVQTANAKIFRAWVIRKTVTNTASPVIVLKMSDFKALN